MNPAINQKAFAVALGILWSAGILLMSIVALISTHYLHNVVAFFASVYWGYTLDFLGIFIGMIWAFLDAAIAGFALAWLYNKIAK
jgi:hypothetical protein